MSSSHHGRVPIIGGVELDLHVLYVQVTKRGGYDKVVSEKKWREISSMFGFSPTTSASYALRKHYRSFLYYYEQVYFFKLQASVLTPGEKLADAGENRRELLFFSMDYGSLVYLHVLLVGLGVIRIKEDDKLIQAKGVESVTEAELHKACRAPFMWRKICLNSFVIGWICHLIILYHLHFSCYPEPLL